MNVLLTKKLVKNSDGGKVLDYIGVKWKDEYIKPVRYAQQSLFEVKV